MKATALAGILLGATLIFVAHPLQAQHKGKTKASELASKSQAALTQLYATAPLAKTLGPKAYAILVFPEVTKAGFGIGGQYGEGALLKKGAAAAVPGRASARAASDSGGDVNSRAAGERRPRFLSSRLGRTRKNLSSGDDHETFLEVLLSFDPSGEFRRGPRNKTG
jgi:hypothetical protein